MVIKLVVLHVIHQTTRSKYLVLLKILSIEMDPAEIRFIDRSSVKSDAQRNSENVVPDFLLLNMTSLKLRTWCWAEGNPRTIIFLS
jgi:hypothetical protein